MNSSVSNNNNLCKKSVLILTVFVLSSIPLLFKGLNYDGHDLSFHIYRIEGILHEVATRHSLARIYSYWNKGYGYPAPIYYGDYLLYFPAFLRFLGFSVTQAYKTFIAVINLFTAVSAYICFDKIFKNQWITAVTVFAYCLNPYRFTDIYVRHAVGEYSAMLFFPIITLAVIRIYEDEKPTLRSCLFNGAVLAIGMTGVITTHVLSATMVVFSLLLFFVILFKKSFRIHVLGSFLTGAVLAFLGSLIFIVPFLDYFTGTTIASSIDVGRGILIQDQCIGLTELFSFFTDDPSSHVQLTPGMALWLSLFLGIYLWITQKADFTVKLLTGASAFFIVFTTKIFPWDAMAKVGILRVLTQVQFPWRYIGIASLLLTLLFGYSLKILYDCNEKKVICFASMAAASVALSVVSAIIFAGLFSTNTSMNEFETYPEYFAGGRDEYRRVQQNDSGEYIKTDYEQYDGLIHGDYEYAEILENEGLDLTAHVSVKGYDTEIEFPRTNYPHYMVVDDQGNQYEIHDSANLCVAVDLPADFDGDIFLTFSEPWYWKLSLMLSIITVASMLICLLCYTVNTADPEEQYLD